MILKVFCPAGTADRVQTACNLVVLCVQDAKRATELEAVMEKQKQKVDLKLESSTL